MQRSHPGPDGLLGLAWPSEGLSLQDQSGLGLWGDEAGPAALFLKRASQVCSHLNKLLFKGVSIDTSRRVKLRDVFLCCLGGPVKDGDVHLHLRCPVGLVRRTDVLSAYRCSVGHS